MERLIQGRQDGRYLAIAMGATLMTCTREDLVGEYAQHDGLNVHRITLIFRFSYYAIANAV